ncbi:MAG: MarR family transcriptional regulator [Actinomycetota bacterium]|nr:MarR family transcriptional regulator [Actinomycetota bacterium]
MMRTRHTLESDVLDELLCFDLYAASRALTRRYRPLLEEHGLTYPQYLVLVVLGGAGPSSIKELVGTLRLDHATLTPILRRMEKAGLLARDRDLDDARVVRLALTEHGTRVHAVTETVKCRISADLGLTPDEAHRLQLALRDVATSAERALKSAD